MQDLTPSHDRHSAIRLFYAAAGRSRSFSITSPILIGRDPACDLPLQDPGVDLHHAELYRVGDLWWVRDLGTTHGTVLNEEPIDAAPISEPAILQLGADGPVIWLEPLETSSSTWSGRQEPAGRGLARQLEPLEDLETVEVGKPTRYRSHCEMASINV